MPVMRIENRFLSFMVSVYLVEKMLNDIRQAGPGPGPPAVLETGIISSGHPGNNHGY
jgi:hypothetical protein